jgi:DNA-directed RNA polymerase specialized sigma24 family protein
MPTHPSKEFEPLGKKKDWALTQSAFRRLLEWLDEGTNSGGQKYEEMRRRLILYFDRRDCWSPDDLADETLNRVARRLEEEGSITGSGSAQFCYIKAREVLLEYWRKPERKQTGLDDPKANDLATRNAGAVGNPDVQWEGKEKRLECLEQCLHQLEHGDHDLIVRYYHGEKRTKIDNHQKMAHQLGITDKALGLRALRIRKKLEVCVNKCASG